MKSWFSSLLILLLVALTLSAAPALLAAPAAGGEPPLYEQYPREDFAKDAKKAHLLTQHVPLEEILGPLAPLALSPFFALAMLSGASILVGEGVLPPNELLQGNSLLGSEWVFLTLIGLTIFTSLPRFTKVSKLVAQTADFLETNAAIIIYLVVLGLAINANASGPSGPQLVVHAGIFEFTGTTLLMILCVINVLVINTVRFFFELMVFLCPIPTVDAIFEILNKLFCFLLAAAYIFNPWLAAGFDLVLFAICLAAYAVVRRRLTHYRAILLDPVIAAIRKMVVVDSLPLRHPGVMDTVRRDFTVPENAVAVKVFPDRQLSELKRRSKCYLVTTSEGPVLVKLRIIGGPIFQKMGAQVGQQLFMHAGILQNSIIVNDAAGQHVAKLCFTRAWNGHLQVLMDAFNAKLDQTQNTSLLQKALANSRQSLLEMGRTVADSVKTAPAVAAGAATSPALREA